MTVQAEDVPRILSGWLVEPNPLACVGDAEAESVTVWLFPQVPLLVDVFDLCPQPAWAGFCDGERAIVRSI
jgi:hypothetical protein